MIKYLLYIFLLPYFLISHADSIANIQPLPVDKAFQFKATVKNSNTINLQWKIAPSYHLYKDRFSYKVVKPENVRLGNIELPAGMPVEDDILGKYEVYNHSLSLDLPLQNAVGKEVKLWVCYQGCSDNNFCYPPETKQIALNLNQIGEATSGENVKNKSLQQAATIISEQDKITQLFDHNNIGLILLSFFGFGLLLSFTPCVLPMVPILSGIIVGHQQQLGGYRSFLLSLTYVLAMSITYAVMGILIALAGEGLQAYFQKPWVIILFSSIFVLLALSLFGLYELQLPGKFQEKIWGLSNQQKGGHLVGAAIMGVISTLIVSPCITAPLIGALAYIAESGDVWLGGSALFSLSLGMGIPLLIIGTSCGKFLPKAGPWMNTVKIFFGILLLAVAIHMVSRIVPESFTLLLWASLFIITSIYVGLLNPQVTASSFGQFRKGCGLLIAVYGVILMVGASMGNTDVFQPLNTISFSSQSEINNIQTAKPLFLPIKSNENFDQMLANSMQNNQILMLDFYADWCIACKEMEKNTFSNKEVQALMKDMKLLQADVTANDLVDKSLMQRFNVIAPPTLLFFDSNGNELTSYRIVGELGATEFKQHLLNLFNRQ